MNKAKRHQKPNPQADVPGGIVEKAMPLPISKVAIWNAGAKKADRVGIKTAQRRQASAVLQVQRRSDRRLSVDIIVRNRQ